MRQTPEKISEAAGTAEYAHSTTAYDEPVMSLENFISYAGILWWNLRREWNTV